ncbi:hypothetical protein EI613_08265 [Azospirillum sp. 412522]|nr:hypothetical protein [Azospirillum sp. 412522]
MHAYAPSIQPPVLRPCAPDEGLRIGTRRFPVHASLGYSEPVGRPVRGTPPPGRRDKIQEYAGGLRVTGDKADVACIR